MWKRLNRHVVFKKICCGGLLVMTIVSIIACTACAAFRIILDTQSLHHYSAYKSNVTNTEPFYMSRSYTSDEAWHTPWTSPNGFTTVVFIGCTSFMIAYRIVKLEDTHKCAIYLTIVISNALYWYVYIPNESKKFPSFIAGFLICLFSMTARELVSIWCGDEITQSNIDRAEINDMMEYPDASKLCKRN